MQWDIDGLLVWLITTSISIIDLEGPNVEADALSKLTGLTMITHFWLTPFKLL